MSLTSRNISNDNWINVDSSMMEAYTHDPETNVLTVRFSPTVAYEYQNITNAVMAEWEVEAQNSGSWGKSFIKFIRNQSKLYPYQRVRLEPEV